MAVFLPIPTNAFVKPCASVRKERMIMMDAETTQASKRYQSATKPFRAFSGLFRREKI
ncbi:MAG: hypothetical protein ACK5KP_11735 [Paludibacteraceae bacterium]